MTKSRIFTYGYDAGIYKNKNTLPILDHAENLIHEVLSQRKSDAVGNEWLGAGVHKLKKLPGAESRRYLH